MEKTIEFLKNIKSTDGVVIIFNNDVDGISSCVMVKKYLNSIGVEPYIISQPMPPDKNLIRRIQTGVPNKIIFLDMAVDQEQNMIKKIKGIADILIIDHHLIIKDLNSESIVHHNPRFKDPQIYQSTSYLTYKIMSNIMDMSDSLWIAALGIIADYDMSKSQDVLSEAKKKSDYRLLVKIVAVLASLKATRTMTCEQVVDVLMGLKQPEQVLETSDFLYSYKQIENEIDAIMLHTDSILERIGNIVLYQILSKYNVRSEISTKLSEKFPDKIVIVWEVIGKKINASVRNQTKKYSVDKVLKEACIGLNAAAGGHEAAGGVTIDLKQWDDFKENLKKVVNK